MNDDFFNLNYFTIQKISVPEQERQKFLDEQTREFSSGFNPPSGLNPLEYQNLFLEHFKNSRNKSKEILDKKTEQLTLNREVFQLKNDECMNRIISIESQENFHSWENQGLVDYFKLLSDEK